MSHPIDYARQILLQRLTILEARRHRFVAGWHEATAWINSSRLIFLMDGRLRYTLQNQVIEMTPGAALLVRSTASPITRKASQTW